MILVDAGPLIALCDSHDSAHRACREKLASITGQLLTTLPTLTEAFHLLAPESREADYLRAFLKNGGVTVHQPAGPEMERTLDLMERYRDLPMDFADASLIAAAETLGTRQIFTLDARDFGVYRIRRGHRHYPVKIV